MLTQISADEQSELEHGFEATIDTETLPLGTQKKLIHVLFRKWPAFLYIHPSHSALVPSLEISLASLFASSLKLQTFANFVSYSANKMRQISKFCPQ